MLDVARNYRNSWKGHGGYIKPSDAMRLDGEFQQAIRSFYENTASIFQSLSSSDQVWQRLQTLDSNLRARGFRRSDPVFQRQQVELARPVKSNALAFRTSGAQTMCRAIPFFRLGVFQRPQETSFYVFNRIEKQGIRWVSYQEAQEQAFTAAPLLGCVKKGFCQRRRRS